MELLYIWIENYKNIKKQGFNLRQLHNQRQNTQTSFGKTHKRYYRRVGISKINYEIPYKVKNFNE